MNIPRKPRIIGFDLPSAGTSVEKREPIVAVLDVEPDSAWVEAFTRGFEEAKADLGVSTAMVEGRAVFFGVFDGDTRRLCVQLRALVDRTVASRSNGREDDGGQFGLGSFRRNT